MGLHIRQLRTAKKISQAQLARNMGKDRQTLHRVEMGAVNPGYLWLLQVAEALEIEISELLISDPTIIDRY